MLGSSVEGRCGVCHLFVANAFRLLGLKTANLPTCVVVCI